MRMLLMVVLLIVILAGAGGALTYFGIIPDMLGLGLGPEPGKAEETTEKMPEIPTVPPLLLIMKPIDVSIIEPGRRTEQIYVHMRIHIDPEHREEIEQRQGDRLHDAFFTALRRVLPDHKKRLGRIDWRQVKAELKSAADARIGPGKVKEVLFISIFERTM